MRETGFSAVYWPRKMYFSDQKNSYSTRPTSASFFVAAGDHGHPDPISPDLVGEVVGGSGGSQGNRGPSRSWKEGETEPGIWWGEDDGRPVGRGGSTKGVIQRRRPLHFLTGPTLDQQKHILEVPVPIIWRRGEWQPSFAHSSLLFLMMTDHHLQPFFRWKWR